MALLSTHPSLRWTGVDAYGTQWEESYGKLVPDFSTSKIAIGYVKQVLAPWLSGPRKRATLHIASTLAVGEKELGTEPFDLIFVDADHSEEGVVADLAAWIPRVRPGGIVAGHDYLTADGGVARAVHRNLPRDVT